MTIQEIYDLAIKEGVQIDKQKEAANIRKTIAEKDLLNHDQQIAQSQEIDEFMHKKYTNQDLYQWMVGKISTMYSQAYQLAYDVGILIFQPFPKIGIDVAALPGKLQPNPGFIPLAFRLVQFQDEGFAVSPFAPCLGDVCADRTRRPPHLIDK